jgi:hypothetical protein
MSMSSPHQTHTVSLKGALETDSIIREIDEDFERGKETDRDEPLQLESQPAT